MCYNYQSKGAYNTTTQRILVCVIAIKVKGRSLNLFFHSGCGDMVIKTSAIDYLQKLGKANLDLSGPIELTGVGEQTFTSKHDAYSILLP